MMNAPAPGTRAKPERSAEVVDLLSKSPFVLSKSAAGVSRSPAHASREATLHSISAGSWSQATEQMCAPADRLVAITGARDEIAGRRVACREPCVECSDPLVCARRPPVGCDGSRVNVPRVSCRSRRSWRRAWRTSRRRRRTCAMIPANLTCIRPHLTVASAGPQVEEGGPRRRRCCRTPFRWRRSVRLRPLGALHRAPAWLRARSSHRDTVESRQNLPCVVITQSKFPSSHSVSL